jgi:DnaK suppressor protein
MAMNDIEQGMKMRLGNRESLYFRKVEEALLRIKEGTYGLCLQCDGQISVKRLEARPTAELCIECKEAAEKSELLNAEGRRHKSLGEQVDFKA